MDAPLAGMTKAAGEKLAGVVQRETGVTLTFTGGLVVFEIEGAKVTKTIRELTVYGTYRCAATLAAGVAGARREWDGDTRGMDRHSHARRAEKRRR